MSMTTRIRFSDPVDPREAWARVLGQINPPADFKWSNVPVGGNEIAWLNPLIYAEPHQGAAVWAYVAYGHDGCKLVEDPDTEGYPPAFVEVTLTSDWTSEDLHARITADLAAWQGLVWSQCDVGPSGWWPTEAVAT